MKTVFFRRTGAQCALRRKLLYVVEKTIRLQLLSNIQMLFNVDSIINICLIKWTNICLCENCVA